MEIGKGGGGTDSCYLGKDGGSKEGYKTRMTVALFIQAPGGPDPKVILNSTRTVSSHANYGNVEVKN